MFKEDKRIIWIWVIFIFTTVNTILNIMFVFGWVDIFWGSFDDINNGNGYTIIYWFTHISYLSSLFIISWSGWEIYTHYFKKDKKVSRIFRYFSILWITITMVCFMPQYYWFYDEHFKHLFTGTVPPGWQGTDTARYIYDILDIWQGTAMHLFIPILCIAFYAKYDGKYEKMNNNDINTFSLMSFIFMIFYFFYCGIATYNGVKEPYPILNWNPAEIDIRWPMWAQIGGCLGFASLYYLINIPILIYLNKREIA